MSVMRLSALMMLAIGVLVLGACSKEKAAEKALEAASGHKVDIEQGGQSVKVEGEGFKADLSAASEWPADMYADVPEFTFGKVVRVHRVDEGGAKKFNIFFTGVTDDCMDRYAETLKQRGWTTQVVSMGGQGGMVSGEKGGLGINFAHNRAEKTGMLAAFSSGAE